MAKARKRVFPPKHYGTDSTDRHEVRIKMILAQDDREQAHLAATRPRATRPHQGATKPRYPYGLWEYHEGPVLRGVVFVPKPRGWVKADLPDQPMTDDLRDAQRATERVAHRKAARKLVPTPATRASLARLRERRPPVIKGGPKLHRYTKDAFKARH